MYICLYYCPPLGHGPPPVRVTSACMPLTPISTLVMACPSTALPMRSWGIFTCIGAAVPVGAAHHQGAVPRYQGALLRDKSRVLQNLIVSASCWGMPGPSSNLQMPCSNSLTAAAGVKATIGVVGSVVCLGWVAIILPPLAHPYSGLSGLPPTLPDR